MELQTALQKLREFASKQKRLSFDEERSLIRYYIDNLDKSALDTLIHSHLYLVIRLAQTLSKSPDHVMENIQNGIFGLNKAAEKFDFDRETRYSTFAYTKVKSAMIDGFSKNRSIVMGSTANVFRDSAAFGSKEIDRALRENPYITKWEAQEIAARRINVSHEMLVKVLANISGDLSLNVATSDDAGTDFIDILEDDSICTAEDYEEKENLKHMRDVFYNAVNSVRANDLKRNPDRDWDIFYSRRLSVEPVTLQVLSDRYDISKEAVRLIEGKVWQKIVNKIHQQSGIEVKVKSLPKAEIEISPVHA